MFGLLFRLASRDAEYRNSRQKKRYASDNEHHNLTALHLGCNTIRDKLHLLATKGLEEEATNQRGNNLRKADCAVEQSEV